VKKLISVGVALALLAMVVLPLGVAAQCGYGDDDVKPTTYAKIPFAIIQTGLMLVGDILGALPEDMGIPTWIADITGAMAPWAGGPLAWTVDMMAWGVSLVASVLDVLFSVPMIAEQLPEGIGEALVNVCNTIACALFQPFSCNVTGAEFDPCP